MLKIKLAWRLRAPEERRPKERRHSDIKCGICRSFLIRLKWNSRVDVLVCDNVGCPKYRQPAGPVGGNQGAVGLSLNPDGLII